MDSVFFNLPNLHFLPLNPVTSKVSVSLLPCGLQCLDHGNKIVDDLSHGLYVRVWHSLWHCGCCVQFENDIYVATSEPHGDIEAVVTRKDAMPHAKLWGLSHKTEWSVIATAGAACVSAITSQPCTDVFCVEFSIWRQVVPGVASWCIFSRVLCQWRGHDDLATRFWLQVYSRVALIMSIVAQNCTSFRHWPVTWHWPLHCLLVKCDIDQQHLLWYDYGSTGHDVCVPH